MHIMHYKRTLYLEKSILRQVFSTYENEDVIKMNLVNPLLSIVFLLNATFLFFLFAFKLQWFVLKVAIRNI